MPGPVRISNCQRSTASVVLLLYILIFTSSRHMVLTRFPTLTGLVSTPPLLHPCFSLASSASCDAFTEQQTSFMEPGPCSTQARSSLGKNKHRNSNGGKSCWKSTHKTTQILIKNLYITKLQINCFKGNSFASRFSSAGQSSV